MPRLVGPFLAPGSMSARPQPVLRVDDRFALRPWTVEDIPALVAAYADRDIQHWNLSSFDEAEAAEVIVKWNNQWMLETGASWAIARTSDDFAIGRIGLRVMNLASGVAEISYWVAPRARGVGAAPLATAAISTWLLGDLGLHRLELGHSVHNPASCRVAIKAGYPPEGTMKSALLHLDGWHDMHWHARVDHVVA
ncbi:MAG: GNAT family N-acetyltransferase [Acidimicrobiaceae bacterium]|nr:GNAT family N-acetyltransferase [Acidimicrobiaceae bacterium]